MTKEVLIITIKRFINTQERTLTDMRNEIKLLNDAIPRLEQEIKEEKTRLAELEEK